MPPPKRQHKHTPPQALDHLLLVDKPADKRITSMTVCRAVKRRLMAEGGAGDRHTRVGHGGTLDPLASGLLVVMIGKATKMCDAVMVGAKTYETVIDLSTASSTDDLEGELTVNEVAEPPARGAIEAVLPRFVGEIRQRPPAFSAMWVDGKRAYALARAGAPPTLEERTVRIDGIEVAGYEWPRLTLVVRCGKGTYIRSLARDIGLAATGFAGSLASLRRTAIADFRVEDATELERLPDPLTAADLRPAPRG